MSVENECQALSAQVLRLLRAEREKRGLSMYAVAQRSGLSPQAISYAERGEKRPSFETVLRIARAVEVNLGDVIKRAARRARKRGS